ncbi:MAG: hypothetical protein B6243_08535 [Anaerolineaceae bacterium 4572_5.2]|nr:MAG: hypothetical protein B6243_08535 [Anaerolineaceae bacterium 4572_5.2]
MSKKQDASLIQKLWTTPLFWVLIDAVSINIAFVLAYYVRYDLQLLRAVDPANNVPYKAFIPFVILLTALLLIVNGQKGIYKNKRRLSWWDELYAIFDSATTSIIIMIVLVFVYRPTFYSRLIFMYAGIFVVILAGLSRGVKMIVSRRWRKQGFGVAKLLIVGAGEMARTIMRAVVANPEIGYEVRARIVPDLFQMTLSSIDLTRIAGIPLIGTKHPSISGVNLLVKRTIDFTIALTGLIIVSPLMALIALAIKLESPGPVIFNQERVGKEGKPFGIYKFRSMVQDAEAQKSALEDMNEADGPLFKIKDDPRRTRVGRLIRKLSLDEMPQLYNVLRGDMSLVGPRPNIPAEVEQYQQWHKRRLDVVPGITVGELPCSAYHPQSNKRWQNLPNHWFKPPASAVWKEPWPSYWLRK